MNSFVDQHTQGAPAEFQRTSQTYLPQTKVQTTTRDVLQPQLALNHHGDVAARSQEWTSHRT